MAGKEVEQVKSFKFLGIMLDTNLTMKHHIHMVASKLSKVCGKLNRLKYIYPQQALLFIYNSLFVSHMNYGLLLWGTDLDKVHKLQKRALRTITGSEYIAHSEPIFKFLDLLTVQHMYKLKMLKFYYNLCYGVLPIYFDSYLNSIHQELPHSYGLRQKCRPMIRLPRTRLVFAESSVLYQLILLLNETNANNPEIILKIKEKSHTLAYF